MKRLDNFLMRYSPIWISHGAVDDFEIGPDEYVLHLRSRTIGFAISLHFRTKHFGPWAIQHYQNFASGHLPEVHYEIYLTWCFFKVPYVFHIKTLWRQP